MKSWLYATGYSQLTLVASGWYANSCEYHISARHDLYDICVLLCSYDVYRSVNRAKLYCNVTVRQLFNPLLHSQTALNLQLSLHVFNFNFGISFFLFFLALFVLVCYFDFILLMLWHTYLYLFLLYRKIIVLHNYYYCKPRPMRAYLACTSSQQRNVVNYYWPNSEHSKTDWYRSTAGPV